MSDVRTGDEERVLFEHELHEAKLLMQLTREALPNEFKGLPRLPSAKPRERDVVCVTPGLWGEFGVDWWETWQ